MKINNIKINGFGKLENKEIKFDNHINLIYGENEAGKTTFLKFISGMFYGLSKNKNKKEFSDFERYTPWQAQEFSGKMNYQLDNHEEYEIFRDFTKKNPKIYNNSEDISKSFNIDKNKGNEFFYEQTKIDEPMFYSTTLIEQKEVTLNNNEQAVLTQKIANILSTGEENLSYKKTIDKLNKKQVEEVGNERTVGRPLNLINEKINKIDNMKSNIKINEEKIQELEERQKSIKNKINEKEVKINLIKKIKKIKDDENIENEKIKINNELINDEKIKINNIEKNLKEKKEKKENKKLINLIILIILFLLNIIFFIFKINKIINIILIIGTLAFTVFSIIKIIKNNKKIKEENKKEKK